MFQAITQQIQTISRGAVLVDERQKIEGFGHTERGQTMDDFHDAQRSLHFILERAIWTILSRGN